MASHLSTSIFVFLSSIYSIVTGKGRGKAYDSKNSIVTVPHMQGILFPVENARKGRHALRGM
jgi:hypothetical protein